MVVVVCQSSLRRTLRCHPSRRWWRRRPVVEGQHLVGIITERDLTAAVAEGADPVTTPVSDYMTPAPEVPGPDSELAEGQMGWPRGGFYTARRVDRLLFGQTGPAPPSWFPTDNGRWR